MCEELPDFDAEGLLDGLEGQAREERQGLLGDLFQAGESLERLRNATEQGLVTFLPAERTIAAGERYTIAQVASRAGVEVEFLRTLRRAQGLPSPEADEAEFTDADIEAASIAAAGLAVGVPAEEILALSRTLGRGLSQAAEQMRAITLQNVLDPAIGERELAHRFAAATSRFAPMAERLVAVLLGLHLRQMAQEEALAANERLTGRAPGGTDVLVCFADLVGFTRMGERVPADELSRLAGRLEQLTLDLLPPSVRLVKTIGDAVMLVGPEADPMLRAILSLVRAADEGLQELPPLHAGVAYGPALSRAGDWFGRPVNLASRVSAIARPGSVLVTAAVRAQAQEEYRWSAAGERRLKGVREPVRLYRARPPRELTDPSDATEGRRTPRGR
ncbi:MAG TPA: adenylate cyclase regulatory domain-containing protein [Solirubrobacteraceae bacterium]|jgi:adenylate cyclase|nr:adenylate cyclase regulatory domain-containing protein [Solirubrobacteraceae bacterium]